MGVISLQMISKEVMLVTRQLGQVVSETLASLVAATVINPQAGSFFVERPIDENDARLVVEEAAKRILSKEEPGIKCLELQAAYESAFADIEGAITHYGQKAAAGALALEDMAGGTFTISNGGVFGSMMSTPIVNQPQSAILGMHATIKRPYVVDGKIEIRPIMYVALSYDHRIIDGREAVTFLKSIKQKVEDPRRLLLDL